MICFQKKGHQTCYLFGIIFKQIYWVCYIFRRYTLIIFHNIIENNGSIQYIESDKVDLTEIKKLYKTAWELKMKDYINQKGLNPNNESEWNFILYYLMELGFSYSEILTAYVELN